MLKLMEKSARRRAKRPAKALRQAEIAEKAYFLAEKRGFAPGHELDDWLSAESTLEEIRRAD